MKKHDPFIKWLSKHKSSKPELVITLRDVKSSVKEPISKKTSLGGSNFHDPTYDISLGIIRPNHASYSKSKDKEIKFFVLKFDLRTDYIKEYMWSEVTTSQKSMMEPNKQEEKLFTKYPSLFSLNNSIFQYLKNAFKVNAEIEFKQQGVIKITFEDSMNLSFMDIHSHYLDDYNFMDVIKLLEFNCLSIQTNLFSTMIDYHRRCKASKFTVFLGDKIDFGYKLFVVISNSKSIVFLTFRGEVKLKETKTVKRSMPKEETENASGYVLEKKLTKMNVEGDAMSSISEKKEQSQAQVSKSGYSKSSFDLKNIDEYSNQSGRKIEYESASLGAIESEMNFVSQSQLLLTKAQPRSETKEKAGIHNQRKNLEDLFKD